MWPRCEGVSASLNPRVCPRLTVFVVSVTAAVSCGRAALQRLRLCGVARVLAWHEPHLQQTATTVLPIGEQGSWTTGRATQQDCGSEQTVRAHKYRREGRAIVSRFHDCKCSWKLHRLKRSSAKKKRNLRRTIVYLLAQARSKRPSIQ